MNCFSFSKSENKNNEIIVQNEKNLQFNITILGNVNSGKTSLINSYLNKNIETKNTVGVGNTIINYKNNKFYITDTSGQDNYRNIFPIFLKYTNLIILVLNFEENVENQHIYGKWREIIDTFCNSSIPIYISLNKIDLDVKNESLSFIIPDQEIIRTSAKNGDNIEKLFHTCFDFLLNKI